MFQYLFDKPIELYAARISVVGKHMMDAAHLQFEPELCKRVRNSLAQVRRDSAVLFNISKDNWARPMPHGLHGRVAIKDGGTTKGGNIVVGVFRFRVTGNIIIRSSMPKSSIYSMAINNHSEIPLNRDDRKTFYYRQLCVVDDDGCTGV